MSLQDRRERWFDHVRRAQRAGGSVAEYARSIQVPPRVLYYWCNVFRRQGAASAERRTHAVSTFTAVRVEPSGRQAPCTDSALRLLLPDGAQLHWPSLPSPQWLAAFARDWTARV